MWWFVDGNVIDYDKDVCSKDDALGVYIYICLIRRRHGIFCLILLVASHSLQEEVLQL
jgi:hypothetical protein